MFARSGRFYSSSDSVSADTLIQVNQSHVVVDDVWLWRADHDVHGLVKDSLNPVLTGLEVNGDYVFGYGLAAEHTLGDLLKWNGDHGKTYFYQAEFPYDVTQANYGNMGYAAYAVADNVQNHEAYGVGAYTYFRDNDVTVESGIKAPTHAGVVFHNALNVFLNGKGQCTHIINQSGNTAKNGQSPNYLCDWTGASSFAQEEMFLQ